jgi:hypothetical protein
MLVLAAVLLAAAANASAIGLGDPFAEVAGALMGPEEAAAVEGGDVHMTLNAERTKLEVKVTAQKDSRTGHKKAGSERRFEIEAHNRVVDTKKADFMPAGKTPAELDGKGKLGSRPEQFPSGTWNVTAVKERKDKFGPNIMKTNAVGNVEVFDGKGNSLGRYKDAGYAIHSNTSDFSTSKSWGCIIVKEADNRRLAAALNRDIACWGSGRQTLRVGNKRDK